MGVTSSMALTRSIFLALGLLALAFGESVHEVEFTVNLGGGRQANFVIEVHPEWAPNGAARFMELVETDFFKGNRFFRVMDSFVAQFGINGKPSVTSEWAAKTILDDPSDQVANNQGMLSFSTKVNKDGPKYGPLTGAPNMIGQTALAKHHGENSRSTQMFINLKDNKHFNPLGMTPFAEVHADGQSWNNSTRSTVSRVRARAQAKAQTRFEFKEKEITI